MGTMMPEVRSTILNTWRYRISNKIPVGWFLAPYNHLRHLV